MTEQFTDAGVALKNVRWATAEIDKLRGQLDDAIRRHAADARDLDQLRGWVGDESRRAHETEAEVARLREECERPPATWVRKERLDAAVEQRDALADALLDCGAFISTTTLQLPPEDRDRHAVLVKLDAALRLAGRLPCPS